MAFTEQFLNKAKPQEVLKELRRGESVHRTAKLADALLALVQKVKKVAIEKGELV